jgi:glycosyltransferase involved in cell wall biosynthesis
MACLHCSKRYIGFPVPMITISYSGVHQAYQMALAAQEAGILHEFHCSLYDAPGKWGGKLAALVGHEKLRSRRLDPINPSLVKEHPWPILQKALRDRLRPAKSSFWHATNDAFDRWSARQITLAPRGLRAVVGTETCALHVLQAARQIGAAAVLDCPQHHPDFLQKLLNEAADLAGLKAPLVDTDPLMATRKQKEFDLAEWRLTFSPAHRRGFEEAGYPPEQQIEIPLWVDSEFWHPLNASPSGEHAPSSISHLPSPAAKPPLRLLFAGSINLRKGIPFLLDAVRQSGVDYHLTLAGPVDPQMQHLLSESDHRIHILPPQSKSALRALYQSHDLFILPSVADTFGFVALEAMACGLPALVSENCGAPVPTPEWRVRAMDPQHLAERIAWFASQRDQWQGHSLAASTFAAGFTPARYRNQVAHFLASH